MTFTKTYNKHIQPAQTIHYKKIEQAQSLLNQYIAQSKIIQQL